MSEVEKKGIGKSKIGLVISGVLIVILAISSLWLYTRLDYWQERASAWEAFAHILENEYEETRFSFYYVKPKEQKFGVQDLEDELIGFEWYYPYQADVFDCSEMSAFLEWYLENEGWHAKIVAGDSPSDSGRHAWLLVETSEGKYMPVEATSVRVVLWSEPNFDNYWIYDDEFETIQDAIAYNENEFDWWKSP